MDPVSPHGAAPPRRRHASPAGPGDPGSTAVVGAYDGYDGRYGRTAVVPDPATGAPAGLARADRRTPVRPGRRGRDATTSTARRIGVGILVGAFLMLAVASLDSFLGAQVPVLGSFASSGAGGPGAAPAADEPPPMPPPPDTAGVCLNWSRPDAVDTAAVDCARPHLFEQAGNVKLLDQPAFPSDQGWQKLVAERCTPVVNGYLKNKFDPDGKFRVGALKPSQARWDGGDRGMRCGLQSASRSGTMTPISGKVAAQDQSAVVPAGTCLGIDGRTVGDPVDCAKPHAVESVGVVDLGTQFKEDMPSVEDQDGFLQPACQKAADTFAGSNKAAIAQNKLTVYWDNLSEPSWKAGSRKVNCNLATLLPDGSGFAAITGSVKGKLSVSGQPAPPAGSATPAPGAPDGSATSGTPPTVGTAPTSGAAPPGDGGASGGPVAPATPAPGLPNIPPGLPGLAP
ncbi:septum formation family protein [Pseudonocardia sp. KRD291]|uniref:septum formation family protein n=1 Tax=Pseudonocardia sp. KRD291 TaxID=2792007 RepID=UPI001C4A04AC|nr:septum formation family protein [Pseudonocardia sp. KRD291]MBW0105223.1 septum formation family protein [Pseudonocardia sp. KRD291]